MIVVSSTIVFLQSTVILLGSCRWFLLNKGIFVRVHLNQVKLEFGQLEHLHSHIVLRLQMGQLLHSLEPSNRAYVRLVVSPELRGPVIQLVENRVVHRRSDGRIVARSLLNRRYACLLIEDHYIVAMHQHCLLLPFQFRCILFYHRQQDCQLGRLSVTLKR